MSDYLGDFTSLLSQYDVLAAFWVNIQLTFWAALGSLVLGSVLALMRISPVASLRAVGAGYVNMVRNTPLTIILVFLVLGVWSQLAINFSSDFNRNFFIYAIIGLSLYHASFVCEAIRSGVNTVPLGQAEAARAIGLGFFPAARHVIFPQALRGAVTPLGNTLIALTKNTTVAAAASVTEISALMKTMIEFRTDVIVAIFLTVALGFVVIVIPVGLLTTWLSRKVAVKR
ncbi:amino acid ABC transporter permease [Kocuria marina]|uniref:amino acid ABC transporter permease n=1 Tax=Kocuria marina TaxID=223184 RepID=UPI00345FFBF7